MKYETLADLRDAYARGELDEENEKLQLDNDDTFVYTLDTEEDDGEEVFNGGVPMDLLIEALELLEIPAEGV